MFKRRKPDGTQTMEGEPATDLPEAALPRLASLTPRPEAAFGRPVDTGVGVPPFRPATAKEAPSMARTPFAAVPPPSSGPASGPAAPMPAAAVPPRTSSLPNRTTTTEPAERRTLVVGRGISLQGTVTDAERLVVEGTVEASTIQANELSVALGGVFKGEIEVDEAEVAGVIDGTLTARHSLQVRSTGKVLGTARCRRLQVEDGGQITGRIEMLTDAPTRAAEPSREAPAMSRAEPVG